MTNFRIPTALSGIYFPPFLVAPAVDVKTLAAADLGEVIAEAVLDHRGNNRKRADLEFQIQWNDGEKTWEVWEQVKKLSIIDDYILTHPAAKLSVLLPKQQKR